jgi:hypothetical protein
MAESGVLAARAQAFVRGLPRACIALDRYAGALEEAARSIRALQLRWDHAQDDHRRALAVAHATAGLGSPQQSVLVERLRADHRAALRSLEARHEHEMSTVRAAGAACAATLHEIGVESFPRARGTSAAEVRPHLIAGLTLSEDAAQSMLSRDHALAAAAEWRRLGRTGRSDDLNRWVHAHQARLTDPAFAQAFLEEVGVDGVLASIAELGRAGGPVALEPLQRLLAATGTLVMTASAPALDTRGPWSRRQLALSADGIRQDLVEQMSAVFGSSDGRTRSSGSWIVGQLLAGARGTGEPVRIPTTLLTRLAAAAAAAEIAESRDSELERRHGTTLRPTGGELFASYFPEAHATGDVLHQLLEAAGDDPERQRAVLGAGIGSSAAVNARGDDLVLAEYLVRRWITVDLAGSPAAPAARLETDDDLLRLMDDACGDASQAAAILRARVMAELARTHAHAQQELSTTRSYAEHNGRLEDAAVGWVLAMRASIGETLRPSEPGAPGAYSATSVDGHQPRLRRDELAGIVGAFAVADDFRAGSKDPAANHRTLIETELDTLRRTARTGTVGDADLVRIAYFDAVASAALIDVARAQDAFNRSMWSNLTEAKNIVLSARGGPLPLGHAVHGLVSEGSTRTPVDNLVISGLSSDITGRQAEANDDRTSGLMAAVRTALADNRLTWSPDDRMAAGKALAPPSPTAAQARAERNAEVLRELNNLLDEQALTRVAEIVAPRPPGHLDRLEIAEGRNGPLHDFQALPPGKKKWVRLVESEAELYDLHTLLTKDAHLLPGRQGPNIFWMERPDGIEVSLRLDSKSGGATIDLKYPGGAERRVHVRGQEPS